MSRPNLTACEVDDLAVMSPIRSIGVLQNASRSINLCSKGLPFRFLFLILQTTSGDPHQFLVR